ADEDPELGEALDRWELALFQGEPFRTEQVRESLVALLGAGDGLWAASMRCAVLLAASARERADLHRLLRWDAPDLDLVRRAIVEALMHGNRAALVGALDETLYGLRPKPAGYLAVEAAAS